MTTNDLIQEIESLDEWDIQKHFDKDYDGGCPCFWFKRKVNDKMVEIDGHCWRVCKKCQYNGIHITGKLPRKDLMRIAKALKKKLDAQKWYSPYEIVVKSTIKGVK